KTVYISDSMASLDVGAVAKGYAVVKVVEKLKLMGADSVALNAGGNIATIGTKPNGELWTTGITNPDKASFESLACRVKIGEISLVTSGDYERYFVSGDKNYHHIIDPDTLMPADYFASVSIFTKDSALADALSTALFCMPYEDGLKLIEDIKNVDVLWIYKDGEIKYTEGVKMAE
ncbi:MAG: FAD:protein FMN transferase, partial [Oscillospiraceae bacterium]|nr:FAD:protein FMN transferase [Oscillospiraceae bacterium]